MRVITDISATANNKVNDFSSFALQSSPQHRQPDKEFMQEIKNLPPAKRSTGSKRIILSDDEDEPLPIVPLKKAIESDNTWLEARNPTELSEIERENNKRIAVFERKQSKVPKIAKSKRLIQESDSDDEVIDTPDKKKLSKALARSSLIANSLLGNVNDSDDSEVDPVEQVRRFKLQEKLDSRASRVQSRSSGETKKHKPKSSSKASAVDLTEGGNVSEEEADDSEGGSSDDSEGNRWRDEPATKGELQEQANKIMRNCDNVSLNLRKSLRAWQSDEVVDVDGGAERDCVDLMSISNSSANSQVLHDQDVQVLCPGLQLKAYQLVGVNWMKLLHVNNVNGVLADDMGLGKTVQTIAFLGWLRSNADNADGSSKRTRPHLIVVPASTLANWQNELSRFCPTFRVITYHGSQNERTNLRYELKNSIADGSVDVILSTYTIFERESGKSDRSFLCSLSFDYLVLDEAHCIKNSDSSRFNNLNQLRTKHRLLLSGTPVQNDLGELLAMLSFLMPHVFGRSNCDLLIEAFGWTRTGNNAGAAGSLSMRQLRSMLAPFVLRRLKRDVLDQLSDKVSSVMRLAMTDFQQKVYESVLVGHTVRKDRLKAKYEEQNKELGVVDAKSVKKSASSASIASSTSSGKGSRKRKGLLDELIYLTSPEKLVPDKSTVVGGTSVTDLTAAVDLDVLADPEAAVVTEEGASQLVSELSPSEANHLFTALRKAANHPLLLRVRYTEESVMERIAMVAYHQEHFGNQCNYQRVREEVDKFSDYDLHRLCLDYPDSLGSLQLDASVLYDSPKMKQLREMLPRLQAEGHRMLVFSQWTRLLDLLEVLLYDMDMPFLRLDGSTPVKERQEMIDTYTHDTSIPVFLLSTKAGGLGINLIAADTVIMHDLDFNPENDRQAEDRCHRIGQTKAVTVYKLVAADTVDEDIFEMGERKRQLSHAVLADDRKTGGKSGKSAGKGEAAAAEAEDMNAISAMLQKALARRAAAIAASAAVVAK